MGWDRAWGLMAAAGIGLTTLSCSGDSDSGPPARVPTTVNAIGSGQTGTVTVPLPAPIGVTVLDQDGDGLAGVTVTFAVTAGGGSFGSPTATTNAQGVASTTWVLGPTAGTSNNGASASVQGYGGSSPSYTASASAGAPTRLDKIAGDAQSGEVAQALPVAPAVSVKDALGNPVAGVAVTWTFGVGCGGSVPAATSTTDALGEAATSWTIGPQVGGGSNVLHASIPGVAPAVLFTASGALTAGTLAILSGDNQLGEVNRFLGAPLFVLVKTPGASGVPVSGVAVTWAVVAGGGSLNVPTSSTNASGAAINFWTLGSTPGAQTQGVSATVAGLSGSPVTFVASATPTPRQLTMVSGNLQFAQAGQALPEKFVVLVRDSLNVPVPGVMVFWQAIAGGGALPSTASITDSVGQAWMVFTVGITAGTNNQSITASVPGLLGSPVTFTASVVASAPSQIWKFTGDGQSATVGTALPQPIAVIVRDLWGNVKAGVPVDWTVSAGGGSISVAASVTDSAGIARAGWIVGTVAGINNQSATAASGSLAGSPLIFTASATAGP